MNEDHENIVVQNARIRCFDCGYEGNAFTEDQNGEIQSTEQIMEEHKKTPFHIHISSERRRLKERSSSRVESQSKNDWTSRTQPLDNDQSLPKSSNCNTNERVYIDPIRDNESALDMKLILLAMSASIEKQKEIYFCIYDSKLQRLIEYTSESSFYLDPGQQPIRDFQQFTN